MPAHLQAVNMSDWFSQYSDLASHPDDPMPLAPVNTDWNNGVVDQYGRPVNVYSGITDQLVAVVITIERFWKASLINSVLPVVLVFCLGMFIFFCGEQRAWQEGSQLQPACLDAWQRQHFVTTLA
jgi:hypothetical protein